MARQSIRILALDVDGTLLDPEGTLRPRTIAAVGRVVAAGIRVVLCTGRRYRRAIPIGEALGLETPLICNSGALVKEPGSHQTLWRADLSPGLMAEILDVFVNRDEPPLSFTDNDPNDFDFLVQAAPTGRPLFDDYLEQNQSHAEIDPFWTRRIEKPHYHLCAIGTRPGMLEFETEVLARLPGKVQTFVQRSPRYAGTMCEILRHDANKWTALSRLAATWGVGAEEICAVGDDKNDLPMIRGAGLGVAMGHASPEIRKDADLITGSDDEDGVAMLVEDVLEL